MVLKNSKAKPLILVFCFIFFKSSCMVEMPMYGGLKEGVPLHSEIIMRKKVVGLKYLYWTTYPLLSHYDF